MRICALEKGRFSVQFPITDAIPSKVSHNDLHFAIFPASEETKSLFLLDGRQEAGV